MKLALFFKFFLLSVVLALVWFGLTQDAHLMDLVKIIALGLAASILLAFFWPSIRGVKKGDRIFIMSGNMIPLFGMSSAVALSDAKTNVEIHFKLDNGMEGVGIVQDCGGLLSYPKVKMTYEERLAEQ